MKNLSRKRRPVLLLQGLSLLIIGGTVLISLAAGPTSAASKGPFDQTGPPWIEQDRRSRGVIFQGSPAAGGQVQSGDDGQQSDPVCAIEYVVEPGDWLSRLADQFLGDLLQYPAIVETTNQKQRLDDSFAQITDPDLIEPGWKLCIAAPDVAQTAPDSQITLVKVDESEVISAVVKDGRPASETEKEPARPERKGEWGYEGEIGPQFWADLDPAFALCGTGRRQSPLDIPSSIAPGPASDLVFDYQPTGLSVANTGHTIRLDYDKGGQIAVDGRVYELTQIHFHIPGEHLFAGQRFAMEMHLLHRSAAGETAIIGVMIREGAENEALVPVWNNLPAEAGETAVLIETLNIVSLLPADRSTYRYEGSLTTPPCSEGVAWLLLTTPIELSPAQIAAFAAIVESNNRPVQPLNERAILLDAAGD